MDPNETLRKIRELCKKILEQEHTFQDVWDLAEHTEAMDSWISKGGFLPKEWSAK